MSITFRYTSQLAGAAGKSDEIVEAEAGADLLVAGQECYFHRVSTLTTFGEVIVLGQCSENRIGIAFLRVGNSQLESSGQNASPANHRATYCGFYPEVIIAVDSQYYCSDDTLHLLPLARIA